MSPFKAYCLLTAVFAMLAGSGCNSYRYMRDSTPQLEESRSAYVVNNPGNKYNDDITQGRVRPGMSRLQVRVTWGDPDQVLPGGSTGIDQVWAYAEVEPSRGSSVYRLLFAGEYLQDVEVSRGYSVVSTTPTQEEQPAQVGLESSGATDKPNR
jgi:hypothetical protein